MTKKYRSEASAAIHETMEALHSIGAIDRQTMREFDEACLTPVLPMPPGRSRLCFSGRDRIAIEPGDWPLAGNLR